MVFFFLLRSFLGVVKLEILVEKNREFLEMLLLAGKTESQSRFVAFADPSHAERAFFHYRLASLPLESFFYKNKLIK